MRRLLMPVLLLIWLVFAASAGYGFEHYPRIINYETLKSWLDSGKDFVLVDTLSPIEYSVGTIPGAINIPMSAFEEKASKLLPDKSKTIVFFCKGLKCHKSHATAFMAEKMGYTDVWVYSSGTPNWVMQGNKLVGKPFSKIPEFINVQELKKLIDENESVYLLDIQDKKGYRKNHLKGAVSKPLFTLHERFSDIPKSANIVVIDKAAKQVMVAGQFLLSKGFTHVRCLSGGVIKWKESGFAVESDE